MANGFLHCAWLSAISLQTTPNHTFLLWCHIVCHWQLYQNSLFNLVWSQYLGKYPIYWLPYWKLDVIMIQQVSRNIYGFLFWKPGESPEYQMVHLVLCWFCGHTQITSAMDQYTVLKSFYFENWVSPLSLSGLIHIEFWQPSKSLQSQVMHVMLSWCSIQLNQLTHIFNNLTSLPKKSFCVEYKASPTSLECIHSEFWQLGNSPEQQVTYNHFC